MVTDSAGRLWTVGSRTGTWFVLEHGRWLPRDGAPLEEELVGGVQPGGLALDAPLLPEGVTAPWNPPAPPPVVAHPASSTGPAPGGRVSGARRLLGSVMLLAGLASTGFGLYRGFSDEGASDLSSVAATKTTTTTTTTTTIPPTTTTTEPASTTDVPVEQREEPLVPAQITASGSLPPTPPFSYDPANAIDGRDDTAWCVVDDGMGESLAIQLAGTPTVTRVAIVPGYDKTDGGGDRWTENRRPTYVTWSFSSEAQYDQSPETDDRSLQFFSLPSPEQGSSVYLTIGGTTGAIDGDTCISEVALVGYPG